MNTIRRLLLTLCSLALLGTAAACTSSSSITGPTAPAQQSDGLMGSGG